MSDAYVLVIKSWFDTDNPDETVIDLEGCYSTLEKAKKAEDEIRQHLDLTAPFYEMEIVRVELDKPGFWRTL